MKTHFPFAVLVALALQLAAWGATETVEGITWTYTVSDGTASLGGGEEWWDDGGYHGQAVPTSTIGAIAIPSSLGGYPVRSIGEWAFYDCCSLTSVTIPDSVTSIGDEAFSGCSSLTSVTIPDSVTSIGSYYAFRGCSSLTSVTIPQSVCSMKISAVFPDAYTSITNVVVADSVTSLANSAFSGCSSLTSVTIPDGVTSIGDYAFYGCSSLTSVTIPDGVTSIGNYVFSGCSGLTSATIPDSVTSIGDYAFYGCSSLTSVTIPDGVTSIGNYVFSGCSGLTSATIPDSVTSIGSSAYRDCSGLASVTIGKSVTSIGNSAFSGCTNVDLFTFHGVVPSGCPALLGTLVVFPEEYASEWNQYLYALTEVNVLSAKIRETDPTILDVVYKVNSMFETVNVRALAFEDGERSFAKVVRPETFVEGTGANLGDGVAANVEHTVSWRVSADWAVDLAKVSFEILVSDEGQLPVELVTIPAAGTNAEMTINTKQPTQNGVFNALLWHYADHAEELTVVDGELKQGATLLAKNDCLANTTAPIAYVYGKMGYDLLTGDALDYARMATRWPLSTTGSGTGWVYGGHYVNGQYVTEWYMNRGNLAYLQYGILRATGE